MATDNITAPQDEDAEFHRVNQLAGNFNFNAYDHRHLDPPHWTLYGRNQEVLLEADELSEI